MSSSSDSASERAYIHTLHWAAFLMEIPISFFLSILLQREYSSPLWEEREFQCSPVSGSSLS